MNKSPNTKLKQAYGIRPWRLESMSSSGSKQQLSPPRKARGVAKPFSLLKPPAEECNIAYEKTPVKKVDQTEFKRKQNQFNKPKMNVKPVMEMEMMQDVDDLARAEGTFGKYSHLEKSLTMSSNLSRTGEEQPKPRRSKEVAQSVPCSPQQPRRTRSARKASIISNGPIDQRWETEGIPDPDIAPEPLVLAPQMQQEEGSMEEFLNTRVNLSQSRIKNEWLQELHERPKTELSIAYSDKNKEKLMKIEQEIQSTRKSLKLKDGESRLKVPTPIISRPSSRGSNTSEKVVAAKPEDSPMKPVYKQNEPKRAPTPEIPTIQIEDILMKHLEGIDTIMESEPNFEQTQQIDLDKAMKKEEVQEIETFRPKNPPTPVNSKTINITKMESKRNMRSASTSNMAIKGFNSVVNNTRSQSNLSARSARRDNQNKLNQSVASLKTERPVIPSEDFIDPIHKFDEEPKQLKDMQKQFQQRIDFFQDFYKNRKSFKQFDPETEYQEFLKRKEEEEVIKRNSIVLGQEKTKILFQESLDKQKGINTSRNESKGLNSQRGETSARRNRIGMLDTGKKPLSSHRGPKLNLVQNKSVFGLQKSSVVSETRKMVSKANTSMLTDRAHNSSMFTDRSTSKLTERKMVKSNLTSNYRTPVKMSSDKKKTIVPERKKMPVFEKPVKKVQPQKALFERPQKILFEKPKVFDKPQKSLYQRPKTSEKKVFGMPKSSMPVARKSNLPSFTPSVPDKKPGVFNADRLSILQKSGEPKDNHALYETLKQQMIDSFAKIGISNKDQLWNYHETTSEEMSASVYLTKNQFRDFLINMGHLEDICRKAPKLHQSEQTTIQDGIDDQNFEKAWGLISKDGIVNILSVKSFVFALNGIQKKWMMPQKIAKVPETFKNDKQYSRMQQRLLGIQGTMTDMKPSQAGKKPIFSKHKKSQSETPKSNNQDEYYQKLQQAQEYFVFNNCDIIQFQFKTLVANKKDRADLETSTSQKNYSEQTTPVALESLKKENTKMHEKIEKFKPLNTSYSQSGISTRYANLANKQYQEFKIQLHQTQRTENDFVPRCTSQQIIETNKILEQTQHEQINIDIDTSSISIVPKQIENVTPQEKMAIESQFLSRDSKLENAYHDQSNMELDQSEISDKKKVNEIKPQDPVEALYGSLKEVLNGQKPPNMEEFKGLLDESLKMGNNQIFGQNSIMEEEKAQEPESPKFKEEQQYVFEEMKEKEEEQMPEEDPILILDIKLVKDKPEKIVIYERDIPELIVEKFCKLHNLDETKQKRLLNVIQTQIDEYYLEQNQQEQEQESQNQIIQERFTGPDNLTQIDENVNETENTEISDDEK